MGKLKLKDLNPVSNKPYGVYSRFEEYFNLLMNAVKVFEVVSGQEDEDGTPLNYEVETFLKRGLFENGAMGYDKITKQWYFVYGQGLNEYGNATSLIFVTANGKTITRPASYEDKEDGAYKVDALPIDMSMAQLIKECTDFMTNCDVAMRQNLEACKTPYIVVCKNENMQLSFKQALREKTLGQACIIVSEDLGDGLKAVDIGVDYLVDKFSEARDTERDVLLTKLGILTANTDKKERVQSAEVNASLGQASDYIYLLIDTFNKQCESHGLPFKMKFNGSMEEIYLQEDEEETNDDNEVVDVDVNDVEQGKDNENND